MGLFKVTTKTNTRLQGMTRQESINAKCKDCIYDPKAGGTWRNQVTLCTSTNCALWDFRPVNEQERNKRRMDKIKSMSQEEFMKYELKRRDMVKRLAEVRDNGN